MSGYSRVSGAVHHVAVPVYQCSSAQPRFVTHAATPCRPPNPRRARRGNQSVSEELRERILKRMTTHQRKVLAAAPDDWFVAMDLTAQMIASAGATLSSLMPKGVVKRRWNAERGQSEYLVTAFGATIRAALTTGATA